MTAAEPEKTGQSPVVGIQEDLLLVEKARQGDQQAFESLVRRYRNEVYAMCYHFVRNREEAWDLSQEAFVKAYRALDRFRGDSGFKSWLMRIAANHAKDHLKRRRLETVAFDDSHRADTPASMTGPDRGLELKELGRAIDQAVRSLPKKHQTAFMLREYEGLSYQEMAGVMECSVGTVMSRLFHARRKLQDILRRMGVMENE